MDYKELIDILRKTASCYDYNCYGSCYECYHCISAATAIETLLAERDSLLKTSYGRCELCTNWQECQADAETRVGCQINRCHNWKWHGPQGEVLK